MAADYRWARNAQDMRPSAIREFFKLTQRPGMISFAGGLPDPAIFPVEQFAACAEILREQGRLALQYGNTEGMRTLVEQIATRMAPRLGRTVSPDELLVTTGSQQVADLVARVLIDPGDVVLVEAPTYTGALHSFANVGAHFALVPCDDDGMITDALEDVIAASERETGATPKMIYAVPNFSNPSGACLPAARRRALVEIAHRRRIPILEDDPYGELRYRGEPQATLYSIAAGDGVLYASSFSKILAPGVRLAWVIGAPEPMRRMVIMKQGVDLCSSMTDQILVGEYTRRGHLDAHVEAIRVHYAGKCAAMAEAFRTYLPPGAASWREPDGGFFFWLTFAARDTRELALRAIHEGVAFLPGDAFYPTRDRTVGPHESGAAFGRLCFTFAQPDEIVEGAKRLARALRA